MTLKYDVLQEIEVEEKEEKYRRFLWRLLYVVVICGTICASIMLCLHIFHKRNTRLLYSELDQLNSIMESIEKRDEVSDIESYDAKKIESLLNDRNLKLHDFFQSGRTIYAAYAGLVLAKGSIDEMQYDKALYYLNAILNREGYPSIMKDRAMLIKLQVMLDNNELSGEDVIQEMDDYLESRKSKSSKFVTPFDAQFGLIRVAALMKCKRSDDAIAILHDLREQYNGQKQRYLFVSGDGSGDDSNDGAEKEIDLLIGGIANYIPYVVSTSSVHSANSA